MHRISKRITRSAWSMLAVLLILGTLAIGTSHLIIQATVETVLKNQAERTAVGWANFIADDVPGIDDIARGETINVDTYKLLSGFVDFGDVFRFKLFSANGEIRLISDELIGGQALDEIGEMNVKAARVGSTATAMTFLKDGTENPVRPETYVESYVPIVIGGETIAVAEVYTDQTVAYASLKAEFKEFRAILITLLVGVMLVPGIGLWRQARILGRKNRELAEKTISAKRAERAKAEFLANMSHEIRTPLNGIMGMSELLQKTSLQPQQKDYLDTVVDSGRALLTVINDVLDFSKIEANQLTLQQRPFDLSKAVNDVVSLLSVDAASDRMEILVRYPAGMPRWLIGDAGRIRQVLTNLVGNAVKFTSDGHVLVDVSRDHTADTLTAGDEMALIIRVSDTGCGIPLEAQNTIFDKFTQADGSSTRRHGGTGLGLAIVKLLVEAMGGQVELESAPGKGTTFTIRLNLALHAEQERPIRVPNCCQGAKVLVVDDNAVNRQILSEHLTSWDMEAVAVPTGMAAIAAIAEAETGGTPFSIIVMDYQMPGMNGMDTVRSMRSLSATRPTPIIMLTSVDGPQQIREANELEIEGFLVKPVDAKQLLDQIIEHVSTAPMDNAKPDDTTSIDRQAEPEESSALSASRTGGHQDDTSPLVLVAEDNPINQKFITGILEFAGVTPLIVGDGKQAIDAWRAEKPDVIFMDVSMPVMGGIDATKALRRIEREEGLAPTGIVGMSAHAMQGDREAALDAGMDEYMTKPLDLDAVLGLLKSIKDQDASAEQPANGQRLTG